MLTCTKTYDDIPFGHRAHAHDGHCALVHGHNWSFAITFVADTTDDCGFVVDFGKLKQLKADLDAMFDHTLLLNQVDPLADDFRHFLNGHSINNLRLVPDCSCEGIAKLVFDLTDPHIREITSNRARVLKVTVKEDSRNQATYDSAR
jgi:6-pyruvoyltetrahydropterin/6-carboxytetrahydropterin synthase